MAQQHRDLLRDRARRQAAGCSVYGNPAANAQIQAYQNYNITWDCACLGSPSDLDITVYTYGGGGLHQWTNVPCAANSLTTQFKSTWWNNTAQTTLQLQISESGQPSWASTTGPGPAFQVNWNGTLPASSSPTANNGTSGMSVESVSDNKSAGGVTGGKLAAAVMVPLLAAAAAVAAYIVYSRRKGKQQRKRWSAYVDHRLSQVSAGQAPFDESTIDPSRPSMSMSMHAPNASITRPISSYSARSNRASAYQQHNMAGLGSRHLPDIASVESHSRAVSHSGASAHGRPASSFMAFDGHTNVDSPNSDVMPRSGSFAGQQAAAARKQFDHGNRTSRVSFAESALTGEFRKSSYFANGPGTASSPNHHRYKHSHAQSVSSLNASRRSIFGQGDSIQDLTAGLDTQDPQSLTQEQVSRHSITYSAANDTRLSPGNSPKKAKLPKHSITVSTSMPAFTPDSARQSIMSPDELLRAYASGKNTPALSRADTASEMDADKEGTEDLRRDTHDASGKRRWFGLAK